MGKVVKALAAKKKGGMIPFRESQLTMLLKDSLCGTTSTCLIATVSPMAKCTEESISTLKFADMTRKCEYVSQKKTYNANDDAIIKQLR